ncbi:GNAT family N-acetyltransferase [Ferruginibacter paludis]|uniref:GNAT family N-acetyltransferase n=1 Tax=Ferruginibacter paludis TaxID=1310417 RepID=UPI0025B45975|nr:GNAT family N-acetyltransferase [Ferruginibacter paludis]MDN3656376.1 GNAT family N-acetyltransferase [Ferruginibacter paludis]
MDSTVEIIPFSTNLAVNFAALNKAWVQKYFVLEPQDEKMLADPEKYYINEGGFIYFALFNGEVAGTIALLKVTDSIFELSKMAVDEKFQGKRIGNVLVDYCLTEAKSLQLEKLILYSNTTLGPAIHLYEKYGFKEVPDFESEYKRANIKMELALK